MLSFFNNFNKEKEKSNNDSKEDSQLSGQIEDLIHEKNTHRFPPGCGGREDADPSLKLARFGDIYDLADKIVTMTLAPALTKEEEKKMGATRKYPDQREVVVEITVLHGCSRERHKRAYRGHTYSFGNKGIEEVFNLVKAAGYPVIYQGSFYDTHLINNFKDDIQPFIYKSESYNNPEEHKTDTSVSLRS